MSSLRALKSPTFSLATGFWFLDFGSKLSAGKTGNRLFYEEKTKNGLVLSTRIGGNRPDFRFRLDCR
jgi:hypothetical protein